MKVEELNKEDLPVIVFDKKLEDLRDKDLLPKKLKKANEILGKSGLPKKNSK